MDLGSFILININIMLWTGIGMFIIVSTMTKATGIFVREKVEELELKIKEMDTKEKIKKTAIKLMEQKEEMKANSEEAIRRKREKETERFKERYGDIPVIRDEY